MKDKRYLPEGELLRSTENIMYTKNRDGLERAMREGRILESVVLRCDCDTMTLTLRVGGMNGYIFRDDVSYSPDGGEIKDIAVITRVGHAVSFCVMGFFIDSDGSTAVRLSRAEAQRCAYYEKVCRLSHGDIIPARVTHLEPFGAFVDIGCGIVSLMTVDTLSVSRISHPSERISEGERIYAVVKEISDNGKRIYLSMRELLGTWEENASIFSVSETVTGIVRSVESYGVFIELMPNLCGLAEICYPLAIGGCCSVFIKSISPERMKIKLIIIDSVGEKERTPLRYFVDTSKVRHIDKWKYSPDSCKRIIETDFREKCEI